MGGGLGFDGGVRWNGKGQHVQHPGVQALLPGPPLFLVLRRPGECNKASCIIISGAGGPVTLLEPLPCGERGVRQIALIDNPPSCIIPPSLTVGTAARRT